MDAVGEESWLRVTSRRAVTQSIIDATGQAMSCAQHHATGLHAFTTQRLQFPWTQYEKASNQVILRCKFPSMQQHARCCDTVPGKSRVASEIWLVIGLVWMLNDDPRLQSYLSLGTSTIDLRSRSDDTIIRCLIVIVAASNRPRILDSCLLEMYHAA